jgi:hypothetical protein
VVVDRCQTVSLASFLFLAFLFIMPMVLMAVLLLCRKYTGPRTKDLLQIVNAQDIDDLEECFPNPASPAYRE